MSYARWKSNCQASTDSLLLRGILPSTTTRPCTLKRWMEASRSVFTKLPLIRSAFEVDVMNFALRYRSIFVSKY